MILSALLPELAGGATGWTVPITAGPAAEGVPHEVQNCLSGDISVPHFAQKLAMLISLLSVRFRELYVAIAATSQYTSRSESRVTFVHCLLCL